MRTTITLGILGVLVPGTGIAEDNATPAWTGTWWSSFGDMTLRQTGATIEGTYTHDGGHILGTLEGNVLTGRWDEAPRTSQDDRGDVILTLSADGKSFVGTWNTDKRKDKSGTWKGRCKAGACLGSSSNGGNAPAGVTSSCGGGLPLPGNPGDFVSGWSQWFIPNPRFPNIDARIFCNLKAHYAGAQLRNRYDHAVTVKWHAMASKQKAPDMSTTLGAGVYTSPRLDAQAGCSASQYDLNITNVYHLAPAGALPTDNHSIETTGPTLTPTPTLGAPKSGS